LFFRIAFIKVRNSLLFEVGKRFDSIISTTKLKITEDTPTKYVLRF